ncbi:hypothetical protein GCM10022291_03650 [Postechiella marina]|uniref:Uncharacterized protein n=1 Tax=Postechiella marina TaxID=943941 RepID=A0ABP8C0D1_9FLAO
MKPFKTVLTLVLTMFLTLNLAAYQKMYLVHQDNVKPSMLNQYEETSKEFITASTKHNLQTSWITVSTSNLNYFYLTPIKNFAELDVDPFADMAKAMGDDFSKLFKKFNACYDTHGSYIISLNEKLSYMPENESSSSEDENYLDFLYLYYTPSNAEKIRENISAVKDMFTSKKSKNYYRIYQGVFGQLENYYLVVISSKDEIDSATKSINNKEVLGPERIETFRKLLKYTSRIEEYTGQMRPDLYYFSNKQ